MASQDGKLELPNRSYLGFKKRNGSSSKPGIIFCAGFESSLNTTKAWYLDEYCEKNDVSYIRFDYIGHEFSSGNMDDFTVGLWKQNTLDVLDQLTEGLQIFVGSSIGGWISLLAAIERPERVHSVLTINNAADYIIQRIEDPSFKPKEHDETLDVKFADGSPYWLPRLADAKKNSVFAFGDIPIKCPVRLLHGMSDNTIPYRNSVNVAEKLLSKDVNVKLIKNANHRFSTPENFKEIGAFLDDLLNKGM